MGTGLLIAGCYLIAVAAGCILWNPKPEHQDKPLVKKKIKLTDTEIDLLNQENLS